jgi:hypothetical protein
MSEAILKEGKPRGMSSVPRSTAVYVLAAASSGRALADGPVEGSSEVHASRPRAAPENRISDRM